MKPNTVRYNNLLSALIAIIGAVALDRTAMPVFVSGVFVVIAVVALILSIEPTANKPL